jgi:hypothetical protein
VRYQLRQVGLHLARLSTALAYLKTNAQHELDHHGFKTPRPE